MSVMIVKGECPVSKSMVINRSIVSIKNNFPTIPIQTEVESIPDNITALILLSTNPESMYKKAEIINRSAKNNLKVFLYGTFVDIKKIKECIGSHEVSIISRTDLSKTVQKCLKQKA